VRLAAEKRAVLQDDVQLPKLVLAWPTVQAYHPADAALMALADVLAAGKASRLYRSLVHEKQIAQTVRAFHDARAYGGQFQIEVLARPGHDLREILSAVDAELSRLRESPPDATEVQRVVNRRETGFLDRLQQVGGFGGKADLLNDYWFYTANPDYVAEDLARFRSLGASDLQVAARRWLTRERVVVSIVPKDGQALAVPAEDGGAR
jgi:zinc protease